MFLYQKLIDRSTLRQGFQIPVEFHHLLKAMPGGMPKYGETRSVKVLIDGVGYDAQLKNQGFDRTKYDGHADVIQIMYNEGSALVKRLREMFCSTWSYEMTRLQKIRHIDRSIGDSLKRLYDYRCQMTGEKVGEPYDVFVVEAHHIIPFTESMNNDTSNIIIISPSYHRIIHKAKPVFDRPTLSFHFPNGLVEKIKVNKHLKV